jgi:NADH-quinone oxidoreductase subunit N
MSADMLAGLNLLIPELILIATALVLLLLARRTGGTQVPLAVTVIAALASAVFAGVTLDAEAVSGFGGMIVQDGYAQFFEVLIALALLLGALLSARNVESDELPSGEFHALLLLASAGMMISVSAMDLLTLYLGLELTTLCSYVLVGIRVDRKSSNEAAIKYFLLGSFASAVLLMGISLIYGLTGSTEFSAVAEALSASSAQGGALLALAVCLVAGGMAFKVAAVPFHAWAPDAYQGAAAPVAAFMASGPKAAGLAALGRVSLVALGTANEFLTAVLMVLAVASIALGSVVALPQTNMKRLLAYSSIAHAGYALLGLGVGTPEGATATMTYAFFYVFMTLGAFGVVAALGERGRNLDGYRGLAEQRPGAAACLLLFLLALTGIPLTAGFTAKFVVVLATVRAGHPALAVVVVLFSVVSAFVYMRVAVLMYMSPASEPVPAPFPRGAWVALLVAALVVVVGGVLPGSLAPWVVFP